MSSPLVSNDQPCYKYSKVLVTNQPRAELQLELGDFLFKPLIAMHFCRENGDLFEI